MRWRSLCLLGLLGLTAADGPVGPGLLLPVAGSCVTSPFGPRRALGPAAPAAFHNGIDLRAPAGTAITAMADGQVLAVHRRGAAGLAVTVRHGGMVALYAHLGSIAPPIANGRTMVRRGEKLGVAGRSGVSYGAHLYLELRREGVAVDPELFLVVTRCG